MIPINVPFADKEEAKALGARWDGSIGKWCIPDGGRMTNFEKWLPKFSYNFTKSKSKKKKKK